MWLTVILATHLLADQITLLTCYFSALLQLKLATFTTLSGHYYIIGSSRPTFHFWDVIHQSDSFIAQHHCNARWITIWIQVDSVYKWQNHFAVDRKHPPCLRERDWPRRSAWTLLTVRLNVPFCHYPILFIVAYSLTLAESCWKPVEEECGSTF